MDRCEIYRQRALERYAKKRAIRNGERNRVRRDLEDLQKLLDQIERKQGKKTWRIPWKVF